MSLSGCPVTIRSCWCFVKQARQRFGLALVVTLCVGLCVFRKGEIMSHVRLASVVNFWLAAILGQLCVWP